MRANPSCTRVGERVAHGGRDAFGAVVQRGRQAPQRDVGQAAGGDGRLDLAGERTACQDQNPPGLRGGGVAGGGQAVRRHEDLRSDMAQKSIVYWRDIPAQVIVRQGRTSEKRELPGAFVRAIDAAAMRSGAKGTDDYLAGWRRGPAEACGDDLAAEADATVAALLARYDKATLLRLVRAGGFEAPEEPPAAES